MRRASSRFMRPGAVRAASRTSVARSIDLQDPACCSSVMLQTFSRSRLSQPGRRRLAHAHAHAHAFAFLHRRTLPPQHTLAARFTTHTPAAAMANEQPQWAAAKVRQTFLDYFKERGHTFGTHTLHVSQEKGPIDVLQCPRPRSFRCPTPRCSSPMPA
jgi:hypothetical protein